MRKNVILMSVTMLLVLILGFATGCGQQSMEATDAKEPTSAKSNSVEDTYVPKVVEKKDGKLIQITPIDTEDDIAYFKQPGFKPYNTYYLDADQRGCKSCHVDLKQMLIDGEYVHCGVNGLDTEWTVDQCIDCHEFGRGSYQTIEDSFGTMMSL